MTKTGPNDRFVVVWPLVSSFLHFLFFFLTLTLFFIIVRPDSDYTREIGAGVEENGSERPFRSRLDLSRLGEFFFLFFLYTKTYFYCN